MTKKFLVIGNPIQHSLSPKIHNYWFKKYNINAIYEKFSPKSNEIGGLINEIRLGNIAGMNITVPFKKEVIQFVEDISLTAQRTSSINTIFYKSGKVYGGNTDVAGFTKSLKENKHIFQNKKALILGAGGVVPSLIVSLKDLGMKDIFVTNRTESKLNKLMEIYDNIKKLEWGQLEEFDYIINATSVGLNENDNLHLDLTKIGNNKFFYDIIYNPPLTNFLKNAKKNGHNIQNGKMMFIYQAQKAFELWHGFLPEVNQEVISLIK